MSQLWDKINYWIGRCPQGGLDRGFLENNRKTFMDRVGKLGGPESSAHQLATTLHEDIDQKIRGMHEYKISSKTIFVFSTGQDLAFLLDDHQYIAGGVI